MKKKFGENYLRKEEKESSKKGMNKKNEILFVKIKINKEQIEFLNRHNIDRKVIKERMQAAFNTFIDYLKQEYKIRWWEG